MRFLLVLLPVMAMASDFHIDHVTVAGPEIHKMQAKLESVGIPSVYGGRHHNNTTEMALVSFPDGSYLELMALTANADPRLVAEHVWAKFLKGDAGPCAWALRERDLAAEVKRLTAAGVRVSQPAASGRERTDGVRLDWETSDIGEGVRGAFFPFLIRDVTARDLRAFPQGKPAAGRFTGVTRVVLAVPDLDSAVAKYRQAYGLAAPARLEDREFGAKLAVFTGTPVILAEPLAKTSWLGERLDRFGEAPCAFVIGGKAAVKAPANWKGIEITWMDTKALGWRLGVESPRQ